MIGSMLKSYQRGPSQTLYTHAERPGSFGKDLRLVNA